jgi:hypothetical protein
MRIFAQAISSKTKRAYVNMENDELGIKANNGRNNGA